MDPGTGIALTSTIAAAGLQAAGSLAAGQAQSNTDQFQAQQAANAAEYGKIQAAQTGTTMRANLQNMLGHIQAVRASTGTDPRSPTTAAVVNRQEAIGDNARNVQVGNIQAQVRSDQAAATFYNQSAGDALTAGGFGAFGKLLGGIGGLF